MQFTKTILAVVLSGAFLAAAAPADASADTDNITVWLYSGDNCDGAVESYHLTGSGSYRCVPVSGKRSIKEAGPGCITTTWSGTNCQGSSFQVPDGDCHSVLYGSVSTQCN